MSLKSDFTDNLDDYTCQLCSGRLVSDNVRGELICSRCGVVRGSHVDVLHLDGSTAGSNSDSDAFRNPTSLMMYDIGLPTFIDRKNIDASGRAINSNAEMEKLRRLNKFFISSDAKTRNLKKATKEIVRITEILGMSPRIAERASYLYRKALNMRLIRGRSIAGIVVATIYIACKDAGVHFPLEQIETMVENCGRKNVMHYYKLLLRSMKMNVTLPEPTKYLSRIAIKSNLSGKTERRAFEILTKIEGEPTLSGKKPISLAASALYLAALQVGEHTTQLRIAIASELTTITIRKRCLEINQLLKGDLKQAKTDIPPQGHDDVSTLEVVMNPPIE